MAIYTKGIDTKTTTAIAFVAPSADRANDYTHGYIAATILFADDFDHNALPKSLRAHKMMTINCTPRSENEKNETGLKRLRRILKALEGHKVQHVMSSVNSVTEEDFFRRAG